MINNNLATVLALSLALITTSTNSYAFDMTDAFESAASTTGGISATVSDGSFRTSTQRGYSFGGGSIRVPVKEISLVSVDKARFSAGCHGIDMYLGGFSFIDGDELVNALKMIAKGVPTLLYTMTLKAIAAPLMAAIGRLQDTLANLTANLNNTCQAAEALIAATSQMATGDADLIGGGMGKLGKSLDRGMNNLTDWMTFKGKGDSNAAGSPEGSADRSSCWMVLMTAGLFRDMAAAKDKGCGGTQSNNNTAKDIKRAVSGIPDQRLAAADKMGNITWNTLQALGMAPYQKNPEFYLGHKFSFFLMSVMGTQIKPDGDAEDEGKVVELKPTMNAQQFFALYMCGDTYGSLVDVPGDKIRTANNKWIKSWCESEMGGVIATDDTSKFSVRRCKYTSVGELGADIGDACLETELYRYKNFIAVEGALGDGMLVKTMNLLTSAAENASKGNKLADAEKNLIAMAPFPLYKVLNIAAASPDMAADLLQANALNLAFQITGATIMGVLSESIMQKDGNPGSYLPGSLIAALAKVQSDMKANLEAEVSRIDYFKQQSDALMHNVRVINNEILNSTLALGVGGAQFAEAMANTVSGG